MKKLNPVACTKSPILVPPPCKMRFNTCSNHRALRACDLPISYPGKIRLKAFDTRTYAETGRPTYYEAREPRKYQVVREGDVSGEVEPPGDILSVVIEKVSPNSAVGLRRKVLRDIRLMMSLKMWSQPHSDRHSFFSPRPLLRFVVMGKIATKDTTWVSFQLPDWQNTIPTIDSTHSPSSFNTFIKKCN
ncbi:uncharacterized protein BDR25DRAFT_361714 [Lindgomyces ingoldianus]|uniref:Uncharacterized protein n=1 Tax=Lindgomyces ingoldianus TaxID=673940 RepID=A0ACB6QB87_9PLEO|nr:uncharacterized protein BDR25DRAFT_361714 [Lindgomyces ingoldianus]KAF2464199.1 hypothetical protein BDR25DRAFT_361714 [Lindgomyces ingoldianus]